MLQTLRHQLKLLSSPEPEYNVNFFFLEALVFYKYQIVRSKISIELEVGKN